MTRQYKKNRARGTRGTSYHKEIFRFGGWTLPEKRGKSTDKAFLEQVYEMNKDAIDATYKREIGRFKRPENVADFQKAYPSSKEFYMKTIRLYKDLGDENGRSLSALKALKKAISLKLGEEVERFRSNFVSGLEKTDLLKQLKEDLLSKKETFDTHRISYEGGGIYLYTAQDGTVYRYTVTTSPVTIVEIR